jgi:hypothetical protein
MDFLLSFLQPVGEATKDATEPMRSGYFTSRAVFAGINYSTSRLSTRNFPITTLMRLPVFT